MTKASIIQPPLLLSGKFIDYPYFTSLATYQAVAVLNASGLETEVIDGYLAESAGLIQLEPDLAWLGEPKADFLKRIKKIDADCIVIIGSPYLTNLPGLNWLIELVVTLGKHHDCPIVLADMFVGGMHYIEVDEQSLMEKLPQLDLYIRYECEQHLKRLAKDIKKGRLPKGEIWKSAESFSIDKLEAPAYDQLDCEAYYDFLYRVLGSKWRPGPIPKDPKNTLPLITTRGCAFDCIFCSKNPGLTQDKHKVRTISIKRIERWLRLWKDDFDLKRVVILDELANYDRKRFEHILNLATELELSLEFPNGLRADLLNESHIGMLKTLVSKLKVSMESASTRIQNNILKKRLDPRAVEKVAIWCKKHGLPLESHYLVGIPGETEEELLLTLQTAINLYEKYNVEALIQSAIPLPGTQLHQGCLNSGRLKEIDDYYAAFGQVGAVDITDYSNEFQKQAVAMSQKRLSSASKENKKLIVNLTYKCNNRCYFCAVGDRERQDADKADVIREIRNYREQGYELLDLDGGEPTLHEGLLEIAFEARRLAYRQITLITNGRRLSYLDYAQRMVRSGIDEILISLHAAEPKLQAAITGVQDSFVQTLAGIKNTLITTKTPKRVAINTTITRDNNDHLNQIAELLLDLGIERWNLQMVTPFGRAKKEHLPDEEQFKRAFTEVFDKHNDKLKIQIINCPPCKMPAGLEQLATVDFDKAGRDMVFVGKKGINLYQYLSHRRQSDDKCKKCKYILACPGYYCF
jgi:MoaA/NifB/PqqE/SkfB family radical SAM enzyme